MSISFLGGGTFNLVFKGSFFASNNLMQKATFKISNATKRYHFNSNVKTATVAFFAVAFSLIHRFLDRKNLCKISYFIDFYETFSCEINVNEMDLLRPNRDLVWLKVFNCLLEGVVDL